jgi:AAA domain-containing protein
MLQQVSQAGTPRAPFYIQRGLDSLNDNYVMPEADQSAQDALWAKVNDPAYREESNAHWAALESFYRKHGFASSAVTERNDEKYNPVWIFDSTIFTTDELLPERDVNKVDGDDWANGIIRWVLLGLREVKATTLRATVIDRHSAKPLFETSINVRATEAQLRWLADDLSAVIDGHDDYTKLILHSAPLPKPGTEIIGVPQGGLMAFLESELAPIDYVMHGAARGEYGVCVAPPSSYKTTFVQNLCMSFATGRPFEPLTVADAGGHVELAFNTGIAKPRRVVYLDFENGQSFAQSDLKTMVKGGQFNREEMALLERNYLPIIDPQIRVGGDPDSDALACLSDERTVQMIIDRINARFGEGQCDIVVIDTQAEAFDLEDENSNGANGAGAIARAVNRIKRLTGAFVLLISHTAKNGEEANQSAERSIRGASRVADKSRFTLKIEQFKDSGGRVVPHWITVQNVKAKGPKLCDGAKLHFTHDPRTRWMSYRYGGPAPQIQIPEISDATPSDEPQERKAWIQWRIATTGCSNDSARVQWNRKTK